MADDILRFAILGLGAGAVYAVTALGVVLVYRGSGVVNFAHGAIGMVCAFLFYNERASGTETWVAWVLALALGALMGAAMHLLIMRPLRHAPALSRLIATLGRHTKLDGIGVSELFHLGEYALTLDPANIKNVVLPVGNSGNGTNLAKTAAAGPLLDDFRDDAVLQSQ